jgi:hypothetical protein
MGRTFRLLLLHRIIESSFFIVSGPPNNLRVLTKSWADFIRIGPPSCCSYSQKLSIQLFLSAHLKVLLVLTKSAIRHRRRMGRLSNVALTQE